MKKILSTALMILCTLLLQGAAQTVQRLDGSGIAVSELDSKVRQLMQKANVTGLAISVLNHNKVAYIRTFGFRNAGTNEPLTPDSIFDAASFSKSVFAYYVMRLVENRRIDLDKPLVQYLAQPLYEYKFEKKRRGYADLKDDERYKKITARMCLSHTTGFPNWRWFEDDGKLKIKFDPGTRYGYSGEGIYLLQFVIEEMLHQKLEDAAHENVFKRFGMNRSSYVWENQFDANHCSGHNKNGQASPPSRWNDASAAGSLLTTITDFSHFMEAMMQHQGLQRASFLEMWKPQIRIFSRQQFGPLANEQTDENNRIQLSYGLGWGLLKSPYGWAFFKEGHDDGFQHYSIGIPDKGIGLVVMTNSDNAEGIFKELLDVSIRDDFTPWFWENYIPEK